MEIVPGIIAQQQACGGYPVRSTLTVQPEVRFLPVKRFKLPDPGPRAPRLKAPTRDQWESRTYAVLWFSALLAIVACFA